MAGFGCGSFGLSNNVNANKSYVHVKLTDSAFRAIEDYLRVKNSAGSPKIAFRGNEGEIQIPGRNNGGSKFSFSLQSIQDGDGPQGSFEFIKQFGSRALESLGPMVGKVWIQAKDDSYEKTRQRMENAKIKDAMNCVKEVRSSSSNPFVRQRSSFIKKPMSVPPPKEKVMAEYNSSNRYSQNNSNSPHRSLSGGTIGNNPPVGKPPPPPPPSNPNGKKNNPDLIRRSLRERIIHLLAVKSYRKPELLHKLYDDGIKEKDKRHLSSVLTSVSQIKDNIHHLSRHLWSDVREDWPFYTETEKQTVKRMKLQSQGQTPPGCDSSQSPTSSTVPLSPSSSSHGVKRPHEESLDPTVKRVRRPPMTATRSSRKREPQRSEGRSDNRPDPRPDTRPDNRLDPLLNNSLNTNGRHHSRDDRPYINGTISPANKPTSKLSTSPISHRPNGISSHHFSGGHSPINGMTNGLLTNGHGNPPERTNGHVDVGPSTPSTSPDSHNHGDDENPDYLRKYTSIVSSDQRSKYKADFNKQYQDYLELHSFIEERTRPFTILDERLKNEEVGTEEYNTIRTEILREYQAAQEDDEFQRKKIEYNYLHEKLRHIKKLVKEYDTTHS